jgi:hypothetical protein
MTAELIGYIYDGDIRSDYVRKNGDTLTSDLGSHITSHSDAEIIAATKPLNIAYTVGDATFRGMYVPKQYLDKLTHVPASIFLKEVGSVRDLIAPFMSIPIIANNNQSIILSEASDKPHIVMVYPFEPIRKLIVNNIDHSYYGDAPTNLNPGLYQLYTFGSTNNYHFSLVPLGEYFKGSDGKPYSIADKIKSVDDNASKAASTLNNVSKMFVGTVVSTIESSSTSSGHEAKLFTEEEFTERFGRAFNVSKDYVGVMNADDAATGAYLDSATRFFSGNIWVGVPGGADGNTIRINYLVILGE